MNLAYVYYANGMNGTGAIYYKTYSPGGTWSSGPGTAVDTATPNVNAPQLVVAPDHSVYIVYIGQNSSGQWQIFMKHSSDDWRQSPTVLATLSSSGFQYGFDQITNANIFPSIGINPVNGDLYVAYADYTSTDLGQTYQSTLQFVTVQESYGNYTVSQTQTIGGSLGGDSWQPALAVAPNGSYVFVGFYNESSNNINAYGLTAPIPTYGTPSFSSSTPQRLTSSSYSPPLYGRPIDNPPYHGFDTGFLGDYDSAMADMNNFYYTFCETSPETFTVDGRPSTNPSQGDIHMAAVPIPYVGTAPPTPTGMVFEPDSTGGTITGTRHPILGPTRQCTWNIRRQAKAGCRRDRPLPTTPPASRQGFRAIIPGRPTISVSALRVLCQRRTLPPLTHQLCSHGATYRRASSPFRTTQEGARSSTSIPPITITNINLRFHGTALIFRTTRGRFSSKPRAGPGRTSRRSTAPMARSRMLRF